MTLSKADRAIMLSALEDAISDRESFLDCHKSEKIDRETGKLVIVEMPGYGAIIRRTRSLLNKYRKLQEKLRKAVTT